MSKKILSADATLAAIEQTQQDLRTSIEASKVLAEKSERLIARHRRQVDDQTAARACAETKPAPVISAR